MKKIMVTSARTNGKFHVTEKATFTNVAITRRIYDKQSGKHEDCAIWASLVATGGAKEKLERMLSTYEGGSKNISFTGRFLTEVVLNKQSGKYEPKLSIFVTSSDDIEYAASGGMGLATVMLSCTVIGRELSGTEKVQSTSIVAKEGYGDHETEEWLDVSFHGEALQRASRMKLKAKTTIDVLAEVQGMNFYQSSNGTWKANLRVDAVHFTYSALPKRRDTSATGSDVASPAPISDDNNIDEVSPEELDLSGLVF